MKRYRSTLLVLAFAALALVAVACSGASASGDERDKQNRPVDSGMPVPPADGGPGVPDVIVGDDPAFPTVPELAPIDELDLLIRESHPPQYALRIVSGIPSGCASYDRTEVERDGNVLTVTVWNTVPAPDADAICTMIYGLHEQTVELGTDFEPGAEYTVKVNDQELTFTAQ